MNQTRPFGNEEDATEVPLRVPSGGRVLADPVLVAGAESIPGYRLIERLGRGGYGEVWKATGPGGFEVALKFVALAGQAGPVELRALSVIKNIRHPHLLSIFASWQAGGYLVLAMELAERTLADWCQEAIARGEVGIPAPEVVEALLDAARGLDFLNEPRHVPPEGGEPLGIQHRDIKPQNLLLVGGCVKVADFGLARILRGTHTGHTGSLTPWYAAPEFFRNETSRHSDQYSLAVTYCSLRGGRLPFTGSIEQVVSGHLMRAPDLSMLPPDEREVVARALAKEPTERWPSCRAFAEEIRAQAVPNSRPAGATVRGATTQPQTLFAPPSNAHGPRAAPRPRRPWKAALGAVLLAGLAVVLMARPDGRNPVRDRARDRQVVPATGPATATPPDPAPAGEVRRFEPIEGPITCLAFSGDGLRALSGDDRGRVRCWDVATGRAVLQLEGATDRIAAVAFTPDGRRALAASGLNPFFAGDGALRLWDLDAGVELRRFDGPTRRVSAVAVAPDGQLALSGGDDGVLRFWDLDPTRDEPGASAPSGVVTCLAVAPDGRRAASGGADGAVLLWNLRNRAIVHRCAGHRSAVAAVAFLADGARVASASAALPFRDEPPTLRIWDASSASEVSSYALPDATSCVSFAADGRRLLIGGTDGTLRLRDVATGLDLGHLDGHAGRIAAVALAADGRRALSSGTDGTLRLWRLNPAPTFAE